MWQIYNGQSEADILQNRFTAYLSMAIQRRRKNYMMRAAKLQQFEYLIEIPEVNLEYDIMQEILEELPLLMQLENDALLNALKGLSERERQVFLARVLDEKSFEELAQEMGVGYKGVAAIYYRAVQKIRNRMKEVEHDF